MLKQFKFGTDINFNLKNNSLVPIAATELETVMNVTLNNKESISIPINWNLHFNYYKIPSSNVSIHSNKCKRKIFPRIAH